MKAQRKKVLIPRTALTVNTFQPLQKYVAVQLSLQALMTRCMNPIGRHLENETLSGV